jgi:twitching motility protein PilT
MLQLSPHVSDLIFSPGRPPQVELSGKLLGVKVGDLAVLSEADTHRIAMDIIGRNQTALDLMKSQGACDLSYSLGNARSVLRATSQLTVMSFRWMALWL